MHHHRIIWVTICEAWPHFCIWELWIEHFSVNTFLPDLKSSEYSNLLNCFPEIWSVCATDPFSCEPFEELLSTRHLYCTVRSSIFILELICKDNTCCKSQLGCCMHQPNHCPKGWNLEIQIWNMHWWLENDHTSQHHMHHYSMQHPICIQICSNLPAE